MRGLVRFEARLDLVGLGDGLRVDLGCALGQVILGHQLVHRHLGEGRVAQVVGAVGEHPLLDLGQQVDVLRRVMRHPFEVGRAVFLDAQQLGQRHTAGARWRRGIHHIATPAHGHRFTPYRLVILKVVFGNQAFVSLHLRHQQIGGLALIELAHALVGYTLQGLGHFRLLEQLADLHVAEVIVEVGRGLEHTLGIVAVLVLLFCHLEAVFRIADGRGQQLAPGQLAELLVRLPQAHYRTGYTCGTCPDQAEVLDDLALVVQVHVACGGLGRDFAVVEEVRLAIDEQGHEAATADVTGLRVSHRQGEGGRHCRVYRVAALFQNIGGHLCTILIGGGHRAALQRGGVNRGTAQDRGCESQVLERDNAHDTSLVLFLSSTQ